MFKFNLILFFVVLSLADVAFSQNMKEDIRKVNLVYDKNDKISMDIIYNAYETYESSRIADTYVGSMKRNGKNYYSKILDIETVYTDKYALVINKEKKQLIVNNPIMFNNSNVTMVDVDESFNSYSEVKEKTETATQKVYYFKVKKNIITNVSAFDIYINKETFFVEKAVIYYAHELKSNPNDANEKYKKPRLEIVFNNININPTFEAGFFDYNSYITAKGTEFKLTDTYKDYNLSNQVFNLKK